MGPDGTVPTGHEDRAGPIMTVSPRCHSSRGRKQGKARRGVKSTRCERQIRWAKYRQVRFPPPPSNGLDEVIGPGEALHHP